MNVQIFEAIDVVPSRMYRELDKNVEQRAHALIDHQHPELAFFERGQRWERDPIAPGYRMLRVWALAEVPE